MTAFEDTFTKLATLYSKGGASAATCIMEQMVSTDLATLDACTTAMEFLLDAKNHLPGIPAVLYGVGASAVAYVIVQGKYIADLFIDIPAELTLESGQIIS